MFIRRDRFYSFAGLWAERAYHFITILHWGSSLCPGSTVGLGKSAPLPSLKTEHNFKKRGEKYPRTCHSMVRSDREEGAFNKLSILCLLPMPGRWLVVH